MLGQGTCKRWQESVTSKMNTYTGECMLLRMVWREQLGRAGVSREVKRGGNAHNVIVECAAAGIAGMKLPLVVEVIWK